MREFQWKHLLGKKKVVIHSQRFRKHKKNTTFTEKIRKCNQSQLKMEFSQFFLSRFNREPFLFYLFSRFEIISGLNNTKLKDTKIILIIQGWLPNQVSWQIRALLKRWDITYQLSYTALQNTHSSIKETKTLKLPQLTYSKYTIFCMFVRARTNVIVPRLAGHANKIE